MAKGIKLVNCDHCQKPVSMNTAKIGKHICPHCGKEFEVKRKGA